MSSIHETAVIAPGAGLAEDVEVGPYCVIGEKVKLGAGTKLHSHVVLDGNTTIGAGCEIFPFASIGTRTQDLKYRGGDTCVKVGNDTTIREYVTINSATNDGESTEVGAECHIMAYAHIAHACKVGNEVIMSNCATLAGHVVVEDKAILGGLTGVHQFVRIGTLSFLGGCTKACKDCPPYMMIDGNPAKVIGPNRTGMARRGIAADTQNQLKQAYRALYRDDLSTRQAVEKIGAEMEMLPETRHLVSFIENSERGIIK